MLSFADGGVSRVQRSGSLTVVNLSFLYLEKELRIDNAAYWSPYYQYLRAAWRP
jgi:hypothetical protein